MVARPPAVAGAQRLQSAPWVHPNRLPGRRAAVPLRSFDLLWTDRNYRGLMEIELELSPGGSVGMEFIALTAPSRSTCGRRRPCPRRRLRNLDLDAVFIPPMTGLSTEEPVFQPPMIEHLLGLGRPGEVLRNLLVEASRDEFAWNALQESIRKLFGYTAATGRQRCIHSSPNTPHPTTVRPWTSQAREADFSRC